MNLRGAGAAAGLAALMLAGCGEKEAPVETRVLPPDQPVQGSSFSAPAVAKAEPEGTPAPVATEGQADGSGTGSPEASADPAAEPAGGEAVASAEGAPSTAQPSAGGYEPLRFTVLTSYKYEEPKPVLGAKPGAHPTPIPNQIPKEVVALNNRKVQLEGYMVPMEVTDDGQVKTFILAKDQPQCCFGDVQAPNEWIDVKMGEGQVTEFMLDRPVKVKGTLEVGEKLEDGFLVSLYRMTADEVND